MASSQPGARTSVSSLRRQMASPADCCTAALFNAEKLKGRSSLMTTILSPRDLKSSRVDRLVLPLSSTTSSKLGYVVVRQHALEAALEQIPVPGGDHDAHERPAFVVGPSTPLARRDLGPHRTGGGVLADPGVIQDMGNVDNVSGLESVGHP